MSVFFTGLKRSAKIIEEKWEMRHEKLQPYKQVEIQEHIHKRNLCTNTVVLVMVLYVLPDPLQDFGG